MTTFTDRNGKVWYVVGGRAFPDRAQAKRAAADVARGSYLAKAAR